MQSAFANEAFLDEIAVATRTDPFELRRRYLADDARAIEVLERLAQLAQWQKRSTAVGASAARPPDGDGLRQVRK
jgi:CO/xanthine dehydrogenase Mo-binding subunit